MKRGAGKAKGGAYERTVCKELSHWVSAGKRDDLFWRSAMSGGRATVRHQAGKVSRHVSGDICSTHADGNQFITHFYVEAKAYKTFAIHRVIFGTGGPLMDFWDETKKQAKRYQKHPLLVAKQNLFPPMLILSEKSVRVFDIEQLVMCWSPRYDALFVNWKEFRESVSYAERSHYFRPTLVRPTPRLIPVGTVPVVGRARSFLSGKPTLYSR